MNGQFVFQHVIILRKAMVRDIAGKRFLSVPVLGVHAECRVYEGQETKLLQAHEKMETKIMDDRNAAHETWGAEKGDRSHDWFASPQ